MGEEQISEAEQESMITLGECSAMNVMAQLEIDDPEVVAEIIAAVKSEVRALEISFSIALMDMCKGFQEEIDALKASGTPLPKDHFMSVLAEVEQVKANA